MIAAGGTAGHVVPALAVAEALRAEGAEVSFIGGERAEAQLVPAAGFPLQQICGARGSAARTRCRRCVRSRSPPRRCYAARALLRELAPDAVLGGGGYVAGPVGLAALTPAHPARAERGRQPSRADQPPARAALRAASAWRSRSRAAEAPRYRVTGRPIAAAAAATAPRRARALGVAGAGHLRARVRRLAGCALDQPWRPSRRSRGRPFTCCTSAGAATTTSSRRAGCRPATTCATTSPLVDFADALAAADLVVARSGGSVFEIAAHGLPAVLVPYPHAAGDHQSANARWMARGGRGARDRRRGAERRAAGRRGGGFAG